ncbi:MAG TPA: hypothetical protein DDY13_05530 [Cytophagales bacterium]|jgi:hypothetical protein|nr:hypothetical protein [Cytophagales bacterium]
MSTIANDPELDPKFMGEISQDFIKVSETLKEASYQIRKRGFSEYPIFPISRTEIPIGKLLFNRTDVDTRWNYYATYLDEFLQRELISDDKLDDFVGTYKDPDEFCCLFVVDQEFTNFLYIPYPID